MKVTKRNFENFYTFDYESKNLFELLAVIENYKRIDGDVHFDLCSRYKNECKLTIFIHEEEKQK